MHWTRQFLSLACGILYGVVGITGAIGNISCVPAGWPHCISRVGTCVVLIADVRCCAAVIFCSYVFICIGGVHMYVENYLQIDLLDYGGSFPLAQEGFIPAFAVFLVRRFPSSTPWSSFPGPLLPASGRALPLPAVPRLRHTHAHTRRRAHARLDSHTHAHAHFVAGSAVLARA